MFTQLTTPFRLTTCIGGSAVIVWLLLHGGHQLNTLSPDVKVASLLRPHRELEEVGNNGGAKLNATRHLKTGVWFRILDLASAVVKEGDVSALPVRLNVAQDRDVIIPNCNAEERGWLRVLFVSGLEKPKREVSFTVRESRQPVPEGISVYVVGERRDRICFSHDRTPDARLVRAESRLSRA